MVAYSFQRRFVDHVAAGLEPGPWCPGMKRHTLRQPRLGRQGHARPEQVVHLYTGMRTRQCRLIGRAVARVQIPVMLHWDGAALFVSRRDGSVPRSRIADLAPIVRTLMERPYGMTLRGDDMDEFARADGFADAADMAEFFEPPAEPGLWVNPELLLIGWSPAERD
jgi:hypothetical protein